MVYLFLAEGFEEIEALTPVDLLRRAGISVTTVGVGQKLITGAHGITVAADITDSEAVAEDLEMMILPGGMPGTKNLDACPAVDAFLTAAREQDAWICAICAAPSILGKRELLRGKKAVCYPGFEDTLAGADIADIGVTRDGKIICARAMGSATAFALELVRVLRGDSEAEIIRASILA